MRWQPISRVRRLEPEGPLRLGAWTKSLQVKVHSSLQAFGAARLTTPDRSTPAADRPTPAKTDGLEKPRSGGNLDRTGRPSAATPTHPPDMSRPRNQGRSAVGLVTSTLSSSGLFNAQNIAFIGLVTGAVLILISAIVLARVSELKEKAAGERVAEATALRDRATAEAAKANERVVFLLQQLRQVVETKPEKPDATHPPAAEDQRHVSAEDHDKIVKAMTGYQLTVTVMSVNNDKEAAQFAADFSKTLREAGLTVNTSTSLFAASFEGLGMSMTHSDAGTHLYTTLRDIGYRLQDLPERNPILIYVGRKPHTP